MIVGRQIGIGSNIKVQSTFFKLIRRHFLCGIIK